MHRRGACVLLRPHAPGVWSLLSGVVHIKTQDAFRGYSILTQRVLSPLLVLHPSLPPNAEVNAFAPTHIAPPLMATNRQLDGTMGSISCFMASTRS